jgi:hypothetical protein
MLGLSGVHGQTMSTSQTFMSGREGRPSITRTDIEVFVRVLTLGEDERALLNDLYTEYSEGIVDDFGAVRDRVMDIVEEAMVRNDQSLTERAWPIIEEWSSEKEKREEAFLQDLTLLLTDEQQSRWPLVERELRRIKDLDGVIAGEGTDVIALAQVHLGAELIEAAQLAPILERYGAEMDAKLRDRDAYYEESFEEFREAREADPNRAADLWERMRDKRVSLRDTNTAALRRVLAAARRQGPDAAEKADALERVWLGQVLSYRADASYAFRQLDRALELDSLTQQQRATLEPLEAEWEGRMTDILRDHAEALFAIQEGPLEDPVESGTARSTDSDWQGYEDGPMKQIAERRLALDREVLRTLRGTLDTEQRRQVRGDEVLYSVFRKDSSWTRF